LFEFCLARRRKTKVKAQKYAEMYYMELELKGSFLADDRPWSALILIKGFIFSEALLRASS
jgi:hypothetical protein